MNNQETVLTFAQGSLIAKNDLVFELSLADQASYFIYCESAEAAERFAFQAKQLVETLALSGDQAASLLVSFVKENPAGLAYRYTVGQ